MPPRALAGGGPPRVGTEWPSDADCLFGLLSGGFPRDCRQFADEFGRPYAERVEEFALDGGALLWRRLIPVQAEFAQVTEEQPVVLVALTEELLGLALDHGGNAVDHVAQA